MDTFEPALLEDACPHPIVSEELLKWTSLDKLEQDFTLYRKEINQLGSRIEKGSKAFKELPEKNHELADIFVIPSKAGLTEKDIIDIRLCAYIRTLEFILREIEIMVGHDVLFWLVSSLYKSPNIIDSFKQAEDTPDVRWYFKNRVMTFLLRKSWLNHKHYLHYHDYLLIHPNHSLLPFLENRSLYIDEDDCYVIMRDVIFYDFVPAMRKYYVCDDCHDENPRRYWPSESSCTHLFMMQSLLDRHESILEKFIQFCIEQYHKLDKRYQSRRLLYILFRVAHDRKEWGLINSTLARLLLPDSTIEIRALAIRLFGKLVGWDESRDGTSFEKLSEHFDIMIKFLESPSNEIQDANHYAWRFLGGSSRLKPASYQLLRLVISFYLRRIDRVPHSRLAEHELLVLRKEFNTLCWLIMPKFSYNTGEFEFNSASNQLFEDLKMMMTQREAIPDSFYGDFMLACRHYRLSLMHDESRDQFELICDKACWLIVKQLSSNNPRGSQDLVSYMTTKISCGRKWPLPRCFSLASYLKYCGILLEIYQYLYDPDQILEPQRCVWFLRVLVNLGPCRYNEAKLKAIESCLLRAIELHPRERSQYFKVAFNINDTSVPAYFLHSALSLSYHVNPNERFIKTCQVSYGFIDDVQGIQSRRIVLVSLCKHLIAGFNYIPLPRMIDILGELELAYKLRSEQGNSEEDVDLSLLPTCVELAFPTPFDDPNNPMYICEFACFRDTMDYLRRNRPIELDRLCSQLHEDKIERLEYYWNNFDKFEICCCSTRSHEDRKQDRFRCIEHKTSDKVELRICPLLNRYQYCDHIQRYSETQQSEFYYIPC